MRVFTFLAVLFTFTAFPLEASIPQASCGEFDYRSRFGPLRDQDGVGYCWAYSQSDLFAEQYCLDNPSQCGQRHFSALDASRCYFSLGRENQGGQLISGLACGMQNGICPEEMAPMPSSESLRCRVADVFGNGDQCVVERLMAVYNDLLGSQPRSCSPSVASELLESRELRQAVAALRRLMPAQENLGVSFEETVMRAMTQARSPEALANFLRELLIPNACRLSRYKPKKRISFQFNLEQQSEERRWEHLKTQLQRGSSAVISMCAFRHPQMSGLRGLINGAGSGCGPHAVVINGMRWNAAENRCEIHMRNSWGADSPLSGWLDANELLPVLDGVAGLR